MTTHQLELSSLKIAWCSRMADRVLTVMRGREFTSDDLHPILEPPDDPKWFGILFASLKNTGRIERTGYRPSERKERNGGLLRTWRIKE